jgi:hypothetical protein
VENEKPLLAGFDYQAETKTDAVLSVADAIRSSHRLAPLTDEQKLQRQIEIEAWREEQAFLAAKRRFEYEQRQAEAEAIARHEAAIERAEVNRKARLERSAEIERQTREIELRDLQTRDRLHQVWQTGVQNAVRQTIAANQQTSLMAELEKMLTPPAPPPEPENVTEIIYTSEDEAGSPHLGDRDFNPKLWTKI